MKTRVDKLKKQARPEVKPLVDVLEALGERYSKVPAHPEPTPPQELPRWLAEGLRAELHLSEEELSELTQEQAHQMMIDHWSGTGE